MISQTLSVLDLLEVKPDTFKPEDVTELEQMAQRAAPEYHKRDTAYANAQESERQLTQTLGELDIMHTDATRRAQQLLLASAGEVIATVSCCDVTALATRLRPVQDEVQLLADAQDLLRFKRLPAARIATLEAAWNLRQIEELLASICAALSHARTLSKLITAGVFKNENRVAIVSEEVERLRATAREASRQVRLAEDDLRTERQRQASAEQTRMAHGMVTRAEVAAAIPTGA